MKIVLPFLACLALAGAPAVRAAEPDVAALQQEVQSLRATVLNLQARVGQLEGRASAPAVPALPAAAPVPAVPQAAPAAVQAVPAAAPVAAVPIAATPVAAAPAGYVSPEAVLRSRWAQVRPEMAQAEVTRLLGAPSKQFTLDGRTGWYYVYPGIGSGSVFFTDAGRVSSTHAPFGWGG